MGLRHLKQLCAELGPLIANLLFLFDPRFLNAGSPNGETARDRFSPTPVATITKHMSLISGTCPVPCWVHLWGADSGGQNVCRSAAKYLARLAADVFTRADS